MARHNTSGRNLCIAAAAFMKARFPLESACWVLSRPEANPVYRTAPFTRGFQIVVEDMGYGKGFMASLYKVTSWRSRHFQSNAHGVTRNEAKDALAEMLCEYAKVVVPYLGE